MGGLLSKEGISKDLESLARAGVGGVLILGARSIGRRRAVAFRDYPGKVKCLSNDWFAIMNHVAKETDRLGLRMSMLMCPGWSHCGGPWIKPEKSLKILVAGYTSIDGGRRSDGVLPRAPFTNPAATTQPRRTAATRRCGSGSGTRKTISIAT